MRNKLKIGHAFSESVTEARLNKIGGGRRIANFDTSFIAPVFFLLLFLGIIFARLFYVQVIRASYYKTLADENRTRVEIIAAPRGIILDRNGKALVSNGPAFKILDSDNKAKFIERDEALKLIAQGKVVQSDVVRNYLQKGAFTHVIGYTGQISAEEIVLPDFSDYSALDFVGKSGLERKYEKALHGQNGKRIFEVDALGKKVRELGVSAPIPGQNINTTLDNEIGISVYNAMRGVGKGAVVVSDPKSGGIFTMYSSPTFDPNIFTHDEKYDAEGLYEDVESVLLDTDNKPLLDRTIGGVYPPGSTFKLISAAAGLESGKISEDYEVEDTGILKVGEFSFGNWYFLQHGGRDGKVDVIKAIKRSNDIYFYKAAERTGVDQISNFAKIFGHGKPLGIDIPGELSGTVPTVEWKEEVIGEQWYLGDTYNFGIGQGYTLATPLQVNMMTTVFANDGTLYKPHVLKQEARIMNQGFIKKKNLELVRQGMLESCERGGVAFPFFEFKVQNSKLKVDGGDYIEDSSGSAKMTRVKVACKTGTAETGGEETKPHSWITVFAPYHKPEIVVTVLVENGGEGSAVAGPIAKKILQDYFEKK